MTIRSVIKGSGSALPKRAVANAEMAAMVDTTDEWIVERTGIRNRYIAGEGETTATLAIEAARNALAAAGIDGADVGLIVLATARLGKAEPEPLITERMVMRLRPSTRRRANVQSCGSSPRRRAKGRRGFGRSGFPRAAAPRPRPRWRPLRRWRCRGSSPPRR